jgi:hypothetical protein
VTCRLSMVPGFLRLVSEFIATHKLPHHASGFAPFDRCVLGFDAGHCAVLGGPSKLPEAMDLFVRWLPKQIGSGVR